MGKQGEEEGGRVRFSSPNGNYAKKLGIYSNSIKESPLTDNGERNSQDESLSLCKTPLLEQVGISPYPTFLQALQPK